MGKTEGSFRLILAQNRVVSDPFANLIGRLSLG